MPSYKQSDKKLERALKLFSDWSLETSRSFLVYFHHPTGTHSVGTKNLRDKISLHPEAWSRAAVLDTQLLNSEDDEERLSVAAPAFDGGKIVHGVMKDPSTAPRLVLPFNDCNEKEFCAWIVPQIKRRIIELGKEPAADVYWGTKKCRTDIFPEEMGIKWEDFSNPAHTQKFPERLNGWKVGEILKQMVRRCLESLGLNPSEHHIKDYNVKTVKARRQQNKNRHLRDFRGSIKQPEPARSPRINVFHETIQQ